MSERKHFKREALVTPMSTPTDGAVKAAENKTCPFCHTEIEAVMSKGEIDYYQHSRHGDCFLVHVVIHCDSLEQWNKRSLTPTPKADRLDFAELDAFTENFGHKGLHADIVTALRSAYLELDAQDREPAQKIMETLIGADNEGTESPWWIIIDPHQMFRLDVHDVASMITGPFFSRDDAAAHLKGRSYAFSKHAKVYCHSGYWSWKYKTFYRTLLAKHKEKSDGKD